MSAHLPALQIVVPLIAALLAALARKGVLAWAIALVVSFAMPVMSLLLTWQVVSSGPISYHLGGWAPPFGIEYRVDLLSAFVLSLITVSGAIMLPYAKDSVASEIEPSKQAWFYSMYLLCLTGLCGIVITGDAFNAFVFLEISSLSTYAMIGMGKDRRALLAAYQYLIMGTIGATFYVIAVGLLYVMTGTLNMVDLAGRLADVATTRPVLAALAFLTVGVSLKFALFPLHVWLPNAYAYAPSFATAFLAATATKAAIYLVLRFFYTVYNFGFSLNFQPVSDVLFVLSLAAIVAGSLVAVFEDNVKRMLAYSSISQIGYITLGIAFASRSGLTGGIVHLFNHAVTKGALFLAVGAVVYRMGLAKLDDFSGIGRRMPVTMACFVLAGLSIVGVPGTAGFISKWYLGLAALEKGQWWILAIIVVSSVIAMIYIGRVIEAAYFREPTQKTASAGEPPDMMLASMLALTVITIYFGFDTRLTADLAGQAAGYLLTGAK